MPIAKVVKTLYRTAPNWPHFNTRLFAMRFRPPYPAFSAFLHGGLAAKVSPTAVNMSPTICNFTEGAVRKQRFVRARPDRGAVEHGQPGIPGLAAATGPNARVGQFNRTSNVC